METEEHGLKGRFSLLSPADTPDEVEKLLDEGADEFYGGVIPDGWLSENVAVNRRSFAEAQFSSEADFARAVKTATARNAPFHLVLNAPFYHPSLHGDLIALAKRALNWGVKGFIAADPGFIAQMARTLPEALLTLSTLGGAMNAHAMKHYAELGVKRAVFPRHLTLGEMGSIAAACPGLEFEAFILIGKCVNEEAFCTFQHISPVKRWPCEIPYRYFEGNGECEARAGTPAIDRKRGYQLFDRRMGCGLCAIPELGRMGIRVLKLVGRGGPTAGKIANLRLARKAVSDSAGGRLDARADYAARFGRPCGSAVCYFPEIHYGLMEL